jgi:hypothetical protein
MGERKIAVRVNASLKPRYSLIIRADLYLG